MLLVSLVAFLFPPFALAQGEEREGFQLRVPGVLLVPGAPPTVPALRPPEGRAPDIVRASSQEVLADISAELSLADRARPRGGGRETRPGLFRAGRALIASGSVLLTTGVPLGLMSRRRCEGHPSTFTPVSAAVALIGGGVITLLGALLLARAHRRFERTGVTRRERTRMGLLVILSYLTLTGTVTLIAIAETYLCEI